MAEFWNPTGEDGVELVLLIGLEVLGPGQQPAGDLAGLGTAGAGGGAAVSWRNGRT
jgi:hypothetical protein